MPTTTELIPLLVLVLVITRSAQNTFLNIDCKPPAAVTRYPNGSLTTYGPYLARYLTSTDAYFARADATDRLFHNPALDLRTQVRETLSQAFAMQSFEVAHEPGVRRYARQSFDSTAPARTESCHGRRLDPHIRPLILDGSRDPSKTSCLMSDRAAEKMVM